MKRSTDRILTTFAGSLIRPPEVLALEPETDDATRTATLRTAVAEVVRKQVEVGVDVVSDGEFGKSSWFTYVMERLERLRGPPGASRPRSASWAWTSCATPTSFSGFRHGRLARVAHVCVAPITLHRQAGHAARRRQLSRTLCRASTSKARSCPSWRRPASRSTTPTSTTRHTRNTWRRWPTRCTRSTPRSPTRA